MFHVCLEKIGVLFDVCVQQKLSSLGIKCPFRPSRVRSGRPESIPAVPSSFRPSRTPSGRPESILAVPSSSWPS